MNLSSVLDEGLSLRKVKSIELHTTKEQEDKGEDKQAVSQYHFDTGCFFATGGTSLIFCFN